MVTTKRNARDMFSAVGPVRDRQSEYRCQVLNTEKTEVPRIADKAHRRLCARDHFRGGARIIRQELDGWQVAV